MQARTAAWFFLLLPSGFEGAPPAQQHNLPRICPPLGKDTRNKHFFKNTKSFKLLNFPDTDVESSYPPSRFVPLAFLHPVYRYKIEIS